MSLKSKVQKAVDTAFDKLKDLSVSATFDNKVVSGFDFGTGAIQSTATSHTTIGFLDTKRSYLNGTPVTKTVLTIKNDPLVSIDRYSEVTINNKTYNCNISKKDEFIIELTLSGD